MFACSCVGRYLFLHCCLYVVCLLFLYFCMVSSFSSLLIHFFISFVRSFFLSIFIVMYLCIAFAMTFDRYFIMYYFFI